MSVRLRSLCTSVRSHVWKTWRMYPGDGVAVRLQREVTSVQQHDPGIGQVALESFCGDVGLNLSVWARSVGFG